MKSFSVSSGSSNTPELAAEHKIADKRERGSLLLAASGRQWPQTRRRLHALVEAIRSGHVISPAAEWLVDNFHIVEEQLREIREDLPKSYYHELPKLAEGELKGYPRIYAVALALIAHTDCRLDTTRCAVHRAYQTVAPLSIGELWAVAITLRLALVENFAGWRCALCIAREEREQADKLADKLLELAAAPTRRQSCRCFGATRQTRKDSAAAFVVQLTQRLREQDPAVMPVIDWLEKQLAEADTVDRTDHSRRTSTPGATQVTVGNIITSMRLLSTLDWRDFFESVSLIEPLLGEDPAGAYSRMDLPRAIVIATSSSESVNGREAERTGSRAGGSYVWRKRRSQTGEDADRKRTSAIT